jgi:hypothetical protein
VNWMACISPLSLMAGGHAPPARSYIRFMGFYQSKGRKTSDNGYDPKLMILNGAC